MSLLPSSASPLMHVLASCLCDRLAAVPCPGPEAMRPETAPETFVPYLAWGWSVDLWDRAWPIEIKRAITRDALEMHRLKGTEAGIRRYLDYTAARDPVFTTPPQDFFLSRSSEDPSWRRWIESLPEIRLYRVHTPSAAAGGLWIDPAPDEVDLPSEGFYGDEAGEATAFWSVDLTGPEIEYAVMISGGVEVPIDVSRRPDPRHGRSGDVLDFAIPAEAGLGVHWGAGFLDADHWDGDAPGAMLSVAFGPNAGPGEGWALVAEGLDHIQDIQPEGGAYTVVDPSGVYAGVDHWDAAFWGEADGTIGTYRAIRLLRGDSERPAVSFWGDRLGIAPYTAEIRLALPETAAPGLLHFGAGAGAWDATFWAADPDPAPLDFVLDAIEASRSLRDRVLVDLDIPVPRRSLRETRRLSHLALG